MRPSSGAVALLLSTLVLACATGDAYGPEEDFADADAGPTTVPGEDAGTLDPRCVCPNSYCGAIPGCDNYCGCPVDQTCDEETHRCGVACAAESDESLCEDNGAVCGELVAWDNCGEIRTVESCGRCPENESCAANRCLGCAPQTDAELCADWGRSCGSLTRADNCGRRRTVRCGACLPGFDCALDTGTCVELKECQVDGQCAAPLARCVEEYCRACRESADCGAGRLCDTQLHQCVECLADETCAARAPGWRCEPTGKTCVECLEGSDCESGRCAANDFTCAEAPPSNDGCAGAAPMELAAPGASVGVTGDTALAGDDASSSACGSRGADLAYAITLLAPADVVVRVTPAAGSALLPVLFAQGRCGAPVSELGCAAAQGSGQPVQLELPGMAAGSFSLWVDAAGDSAGAFELEVEARVPAAAPSNDICAAPQPIAFVDGVGLAAGDTRGATDDYAATCAYSDGPDLAYRFDLTEPREVTVTATADPATPAFRPTVYLRAACEGPGAENERACGGPQAGGGTAVAVAGRLAAGPWYAVVDGAHGTAGRFDLRMDLGEPQPIGDGCADAFPLDLSNGSATVRADLSGATADVEASCGGSGPDAVYRLDLAQPRRLSVSLVPGSTLQPVLHLRRDCADGGTQRACVAGDAAGDPAGFGPLALEAGPWFLWVDGFGGTRGTFELSVTATP